MAIPTPPESGIEDGRRATLADLVVVGSIGPTTSGSPRNGLPVTSSRTTPSGPSRRRGRDGLAAHQQSRDRKTAAQVILMSRRGEPGMGRRSWALRCLQQRAVDVGPEGLPVTRLRLGQGGHGLGVSDGGQVGRNRSAEDCPNLRGGLRVCLKPPLPLDKSARSQSRARCFSRPRSALSGGGSSAPGRWWPRMPSRPRYSGHGSSGRWRVWART